MKAEMRFHPTPYKSVLWNHLLKIESLVKSRHTWKEITRVLNEEIGVNINQTTVFKFYNRYASRNRPLPHSIRMLVDEQNPKRKEKPKTFIFNREKQALKLLEAD